MSREELAAELRQASMGLSDAALIQELGGILPPEELAGLVFRIRTSVEKVVTYLLLV